MVAKTKPKQRKSREFVELLLQVNNDLAITQTLTQALESLDKALRLQPRFCMALWNKGAVLKALERWDDALGVLEKVNNVCPSYIEPYLLKGKVLYFGKRDVVGAVSALKKVKELDPEGELGREADEMLRQIPAK